MSNRVISCWLSFVVVILITLNAAATESSSVQSGYRIGPNDVIRIQVFGEEDLTVENRVGGDGKLNYPLLGVLQVGGQTTEELQADLTKRLAAGYVRLPKVSVSIVRHRNVYVSGEVKVPGGFPFEDGLTAQRAITMAGGFTEKADKQGLKVTRVTEAGAQTLAIGSDDPILPNDILTVSSHNHKVYISGEVRTPGAYPYSDNISLQKALTMAGGVTEKAHREDLTVRRLVDGQDQTLVLKLDALVQPEDLIVVREGQKVYVTGEVKTPGRYGYEPGATIQRALTLAGGVTEKAEAAIVKVTRMKEHGVETAVFPQDALVLPEDIILVVPVSAKFYVSGEVKTPGSYVHKEGLSLQKALAMAGGLTEKGDLDRLKIVRIVDAQEEHPQITLDTPVLPDDTIVVFERQKFYVTGEVKTPGRYFYEVGLSMQKAITMAGGFTEKADKLDLRVERHQDKAVVTAPAGPNAQVFPDDLIVVPQARRFYVNGEVKRPGDYYYERGLTLHMAITMAGGFTDKASKTPKVLRKVNGQEGTIELALDAPVLPDDIIVVQQRFF
ncbi:MAG: SLBB domain-containing protein [Nitrospira sp.]|nr:SLBB domain-containing protein [Nitrospira sp.]